MAPQTEPQDDADEQLKPPIRKRKRRPMLLPIVGVVSFTLLILSALPSNCCFRLPLPRSTMREFTTSWFRRQRQQTPRLYSHVIPPNDSALSNLTLRDFVTHPDGIHLAMAPAFFGFFCQFGALIAWEEGISRTILQSQIKCLAGASAGAMTAVLLSSGISPAVAAKFCESVTLDKFADPPGLFAIFKGNLFHDLMRDFMKETATTGSSSTLLLQDGTIPVAVTAFDLKSMSNKILTRGSMPLAARASACFPLLFQPVSWQNDDDNESSSSWFIDGGIGDTWGLQGLAAFPSPKRVVHIAVGNPAHVGPSDMDDDVSSVLSISIQNTPQPHPWNMANGPRAVEASRRAMLASLDLPLYRGTERGHYILDIDATEFVPA